MELYELKEHCREQLKKLPRTSKMYEEHLLVLALIATNKKYFEELEQKEKQIELMAEAFKQDDARTVEEIIEYFKNLAKENNNEI